jgi:acyl carrier protein
MEAVSRQRRAAGLPALAVEWGGISDTGMLARDDDVARAIARRTGATFTSAEALSALGRMLTLGRDAPPVATIAPLNWPGLKGQLPIVSRPMFAALAGSSDSAAAAEPDAAGLAARIRALPEDEAREAIVQHLREAVARVFRMPLADVRNSRSLADLGMDSLMGLELRLAVQQRLGADVPLALIAPDRSLAEIAARITTSIRGSAAADGGGRAGTGVEVDLAHQHGTAGASHRALQELAREIDRRELPGRGAGETGARA